MTHRVDQATAVDRVGAAAYPAVRIRESEDYETIAELDRTCLPLDTPAVLDGRIWWVAETAGGQAVGYAACRMLPHDTDTAYLARAGVVPYARGFGLQRRLIRARLQWAKRQGARVCLTDTAPYNYRSSNNLIACGFRLYSPAYRWGDTGALYWWRDLAAPVAAPTSTH